MTTVDFDAVVRDDPILACVVGEPDRDRELRLTWCGRG